MTALLVDDLAQFIRRVDGDNELSPTQLGGSIALFLRDRGTATDETTENAIEDFVYERNVGVGYRHPKLLTGEALAELIVAEFKLDEEQR